MLKILLLIALVVVCGKGADVHKDIPREVQQLVRLRKIDNLPIMKNDFSAKMTSEIVCFKRHWI